MSEKEKEGSTKDMFEDMNESHGGRKEGDTPDYEKNQSPSTPQDEFDTIKKSSF